MLHIHTETVFMFLPILFFSILFIILFFYYKHPNKKILRLAQKLQKAPEATTYIITYKTNRNDLISAIIQLGNNLSFYSWMKTKYKLGYVFFNIQKFNSINESHILTLLTLLILDTEESHDIFPNIPQIFIKQLLSEELKEDRKLAIFFIDQLLNNLQLSNKPTFNNSKQKRIYFTQ
jgi:hypothetical protein